MADDIPRVTLTFKNDAPVVQVNDVDANSIAEVLDAAPALKTDAGAAEVARAVTHFAQGYEFDVILNPARFAERFRTKFAAEPEGPFVEGRPRLTDFGMPDLEQIAVPHLEGEMLVFYAEDGFRGIPYKVEVKFGAAATNDDFKPVPLVP